jgi:hypothetical protein
VAAKAVGNEGVVWNQLQLHKSRGAVLLLTYISELITAVAGLGAPPGLYQSPSPKNGVFLAIICRPALDPPRAAQPNKPLAMT